MGTKLWRFGGKKTHKTSNGRKTCWVGTSLCQTASFEPLCVKLFLSISLSECILADGWPVLMHKKMKKKTGRKEGRKVTRTVYFTCVWGELCSWRIPTKRITYLLTYLIYERRELSCSRRGTCVISINASQILQLTGSYLHNVLGKRVDKSALSLTPRLDA